MDKNHFLLKFDSKTDLELRAIAESKEEYVIEARYAAVQILKSRDIRLELEKSILAELEEEAKRLQKPIIDEARQTQEIIRRLNNIPIGKKRDWHLKNGNDIQVKRLSETRFRIRIEDHFQSYMAPLIICEVSENSTFKTYPFFYLKPILWSLIISIALFALDFSGFLDLTDMPNFAFFPIVVVVLIQLLLMPMIYLIVRRQFRNELGKY